jgi:hypothetical protein
MLATLPTKRKLIDLTEDTIRTLSVKAALEGTNVKKLIENMLLSEAIRIEEEAEYAMYVHLLQSDPNGKVYLSQEESLNLEKRLGL